MIDYARPYEQNMCDVYFPPTPTAPERLDNFQVFRKGTASHIYGNYYSTPTYDAYADPDIDSTVSVYHNMVSCRDYNYRDDWKKKFVHEWTEEDSVAWIIDAVQCMGISEFDVPYHNFRISGLELRSLKREDVQQRMAHLSIEPSLSRRIADNIFEKLHVRLNDDIMANATYERSMFRYADTSDPYQQDSAQTVLDLDSIDHKNRVYTSDYRPNDSRLLAACDSSDDQEDAFRTSENASPECSYGSDGSKSGDEDAMRKMPKRPPGRPKGSGRKMMKRPRSVSVPEFLRNLLLDPKYCPTIIKWEDHSLGKFRLV
ncbi:Transcription factor BmEts [Operophtera brumata]|uniref:Transcription factor BmEts n=1 Tax=Operophtera brumata TaxID=104452 RepID=A0A0L7LRQ8_OPEBR|nr:Transcription factor BmEts [Operophtera brumata]